MDGFYYNEVVRCLICHRHRHDHLNNSSFFLMKTNYLRRQMEQWNNGTMERPKYKNINSIKHVGIKNGNECQQKLRPTKNQA